MDRLRFKECDVRLPGAQCPVAVPVAVYEQTNDLDIDGS